MPMPMPMPMPMDASAPRAARIAPEFVPAPTDVRCPWCGEWVPAAAADCPSCRHTALVPGHEQTRTVAEWLDEPSVDLVPRATIQRAGLFAVGVAASAAVLLDLAHVYLLRQFLRLPSVVTEDHLVRSENWQRLSDLAVVASVVVVVVGYAHWRSRLSVDHRMSRILRSPRRHDVFWSMVVAAVSFPVAAWWVQSGLPGSPDSVETAVRISIVLQIPGALFLLLAAVSGVGVLAAVEDHQRGVRTP